MKTLVECIEYMVDEYDKVPGVPERWRKAIEAHLRRLARAEELLREAYEKWGEGVDTECGCQECQFETRIRAFLAPEQPAARSCETCKHESINVFCSSDGCCATTWRLWEPKL